MKVSAMKSTVRFIAIRTPMSRTRAARSGIPLVLACGVAEQLDQKGSADVEPLRHPGSRLGVAFICSCDRAARRRPIHRAGSRKNGTNASAARVSCQDSASHGRDDEAQ